MDAAAAYSVRRTGMDADHDLGAEPAARAPIALTTFARAPVAAPSAEASLQVAPPALAPIGGALVPVGGAERIAALSSWLAAMVGIEPFLRLAMLHPTLAHGILLPVAALLVMAFALGGLPAVVVGAYFIGCGMILSRKAVLTLLDGQPQAACGRAD